MLVGTATLSGGEVIEVIARPRPNPPMDANSEVQDADELKQMNEINWEYMG